MTAPSTLDPLLSRPAASSDAAALAPTTLTVAGHSLTVFAESPPLFDAMLRDILAAESRVWAETYIFANDAGGRRIAEALMAKARQGLDIRVMIDAVGSAATPWTFFTDMISAGVQVHVFHTLLEGLSRFRPLTILNRRNHRKLMVIDQTAGYFGGMNLIGNVAETPGQSTTSERFHDLTAQRLDEGTLQSGANATGSPGTRPTSAIGASLPPSSGWRDIHIRLAGPQLPELADSFERSWRRARREPLRRPPRGQFRARLRQITQNSEPSTQHSAEAIRFFDSGHIRGEERFSRAARIYAGLIRRARFQITLSMAYFLPTGPVLRAILAARRRRVGVRVIVPGQSDVPLVQRASEYLYDRLLKRGIRLYERQRRMLHSKVMIVDDQYTLVGSANLDPRSLYTNREFLAVIRSQALARVMQKICRYEIAQSRRITLNTCRGHGLLRRLLNRFAWSLRWWL